MCENAGPFLSVSGYILSCHKSDIGGGAAEADATSITVNAHTREIVTPPDLSLEVKDMCRFLARCRDLVVTAIPV
jgi:hypothetical protein